MSPAHGPGPLTPPVSALQATVAWIALCVLAGGSLALSYAHLGDAAGPGVALGIGAIKATIIAVFFMHLPHARAMPVISALGAVVFIGLLAGLVGVDVASRVRMRVPTPPATDSPAGVPTRHASRTGHATNR